ncbi:hypothetical protein A8990_10775 [Paenibacillus taihuensis]|uniref:Uncharacterized protein n=1 Tax=Paenibacillus taihuensis TaxID=1156355 RepID=A0A3D9SIZ5_9BACL|nr:hypothetical protein [Paenibacillus taihuensis]REE88979.1 hypothetical protein A8990_10775 [Paenibacillus taihuensis]
MRRSRAYLSQFSTNQLHLRHPWVVTFFAFSYPGFGNLILHRYAKAFILIIWEIFINNEAKVNLAIMYTLQGHFETAKAVINERWFILYVGIYMYAIWDSYRSTLDINKQYLLADREDAPLDPIRMGPWDTNYLDKRVPWVALAWSMLVPGLGHMYVHKVISGVFIFGYTIAIMYYSHLPQSIHFTLVGDFVQAKQIINMQWCLYLPSIYTFIFYDAYVSAVEQNKLFEKEQSQFLRLNYRDPKLQLSQLLKVKKMLVVATFEQSIFLELAITAMEQMGIPKGNLHAFPMDKWKEPRSVLDSIHRADGYSMLDLAAILGTCFMLLGAIYGFELKWGPVLWGIIGAVLGIALGFFIKFIMMKKSGNGDKRITSEVVLMVQCETSQWELVKKILWENTALGISTVNENPSA